MSRESAALRGQVFAEQGMTDTVTITRKTGEVVSGGVITPTYAVVYTGKARLQQRSIVGSRSDIGQASVVVESREVQLPVSVNGLKEGDVVTVVASQDGDAVGRVFVIRDVLAKSHLTSRRVTVTEVTS